MSLGGTRLLCAVICCAAVATPLLAHSDLDARLDAPPHGGGFSYLYVDSNEDRASGGHAAIRIGDDVFHFQYERGLMRLDWDDWRDFELDYRGFQNRTLHASRVAVTADTEARLHSAFRLRHLSRSRQIELLDDARADRDLVAALLDPGRPALRLPGLGFFESDPGAVGSKGSRAIRGLRDAIASDARTNSNESWAPLPPMPRMATMTRTTRMTRIVDIESALAALPALAMDLAAEDFERDAFPRPRYPFHARYADLVAARRALEVLAESASLRADALSSRAEVSGDVRGSALTPHERDRLEESAAALEAQLVELARGTRPDWGPALLLGMARLAAMEASLRRGEWLLLDVFGPESERLEIGERRRELLPALAAHAQADWRTARERFIAAEGFDEVAHTALEENLSRWLELRRALAGASEIRIARDRQLPRRIGPLAQPDVPFALKRAGLSRLAAMEHSLAIAESEAKAGLGYRLITRNCVSELFALVDDTMKKSLQEQGLPAIPEAVVSESTRRLGGYVSATFLPGVIPFVASHRVRKHWRVTETRELLSLRRQSARELREAASTPWVALRESNTLTSTLYVPGEEDSFFVFFTDDTVALRPVLGALNLSAALAGAGVGILRAPFDRGRSLDASLRGALFSLPELAFQNIRKGTSEWATRASMPQPLQDGNRDTIARH